MFTVHSVRSRDQGTGNQHGLVSRYITKLYDRWTNQTNQSSADGNVFKMPYNSTAVRAMFFSSIQSKIYCMRNWIDDEMISQLLHLVLSANTLENKDVGRTIIVLLYY